ncbi:uncharacterized protein BDR25DRAFT_351004 [Lindgomyces ingoldianus]|uniref:Uncharacterized protein n=1 Tax=Lindgomyces ingoldianus TaxID=673940 RepID=A0ACB6R5M9_9PLEO|nr:uncharacterized protein BDR25DRAFT_351004 [Lindgomyces ingoldianus]KAF2474481.1 hypothetical protein BDR25DRAFT_351004 [Lindgomyces ingoldianus]
MNTTKFMSIDTNDVVPQQLGLPASYEAQKVVMIPGILQISKFPLLWSVSPRRSSETAFLYFDDQVVENILITQTANNAKETLSRIYPACTGRCSSLHHPKLLIPVINNPKIKALHPPRLAGAMLIFSVSMQIDQMPEGEREALLNCLYTLGEGNWKGEAVMKDGREYLSHYSFGRMMTFSSFRLSILSHFLPYEDACSSSLLPCSLNNSFTLPITLYFCIHVTRREHLGSVAVPWANTLHQFLFTFEFTDHSGRATGLISSKKATKNPIHVSGHIISQNATLKGVRRHFDILNGTRWRYLTPLRHPQQDPQDKDPAHLLPSGYKGSVLRTTAPAQKLDHLKRRVDDKDNMGIPTVSMGVSLPHSGEW